MKLIDYTDSASFSSRLRRKRMGWLADFLAGIIARDSLKRVTICDIGGTGTYWNGFPFGDFPSVFFAIDLYNLQYPEYDAKLSSGRNFTFEKRVGDATDLIEVVDRRYDVAHSNSVIEHVGGFEGAAKMATETHRVARYHFVQTPSFWFPIEPHLLIPFYFWLPRPARWRILELIKGSSTVDAVRRDASIWLLNRRMVELLFPGSEILVERFIGLPKSFVARSRLGAR